MGIIKDIFTRSHTKTVESDKTILGHCEFISDGTVDEYQSSIAEGSKWNKVYKKWNLK